MAYIYTAFSRPLIHVIFIISFYQVKISFKKRQIMLKNNPLTYKFHHTITATE